MQDADICPRCGSHFVCGMKAGTERCWCAELPPLTADPEPRKPCFCPACMKELLERETQARS
jgi:hypothetical protein